MRVLPQMINTVLPIFLVIGVGYILRYREFLTNDTNDRLSKLVFYIALPALLFKSTASTPLALAVDSRTLGCAAGVMVFTAFALYAAAFRMDPSRRGVFTQGAMRSNMVFVGLLVMKRMNSNWEYLDNMSKNSRYQNLVICLTYPINW